MADDVAEGHTTGYCAARRRATRVLFWAASMRHARGYVWTGAVLLAAAPLVVALCVVLWQTPFPISEAVAIFEDIERRPATRFLIPDTSYYRPAFHMSVSAIWHNAGALDRRLTGVKLLQIVPAVLLIVLLVWAARPRGALEAGAAMLAVAVLVGSPGFRDNVEIPLSYTTVGMPLALLAWMLLNGRPRAWTGVAVILLAVVAIGFKEQGLVLVPLIVIAWWTGAPAAGGRTAAAAVVLTCAYIVLRLSWSGSWPMFEQAIGLGFGEMEPAEARARYGDFPYWLYAYNGASTIANVLLSEPTRGTFTIARSIADGTPAPWQLVQLGSSLALTAIVAWWATVAIRDGARHGWTPQSRLALALVVALLASGALSFNYSRDRLGGMALPFYALAAFHAVRAVAARAAAAPPRGYAATAVLLVLLASAWHVRAIGSVERSRQIAMRNQGEWMLHLPARRAEFAERATYLRIMDDMLDQGVRTRAPGITRYPRWLSRLLGTS